MTEVKNKDFFRKVTGLTFLTGKTPWTILINEITDLYKVKNYEKKKKFLFFQKPLHLLKNERIEMKFQIKTMNYYTFTINTKTLKIRLW